MSTSISLLCTVHAKQIRCTCNPKGDTLPETIDANNAANIGLDGNSDRLSFMGTWAHSEHIAPPHLLHIGTIENKNVQKPTQSGEFTLHEAEPNTDKTMLLELPLRSKALEGIINKEFAKLSAVESVNALGTADYTTYIGKIPGKAKVGIYAAPQPDKLSRKYAPIFLIKEVDAGAKFTIGGDFEFTAKTIDQTSSTVQLHLY